MHICWIVDLEATISRCRSQSYTKSFSGTWCSFFILKLNVVIDVVTFWSEIILVPLVQLDQLDKIFKVLGKYLLTVFLSPCWGMFILLMIFQTHILGHCYCARPSHIRKVAFLSKSPPLATRFATYTRTQIVRSLIDVYSNICRG